MWMENLEDNRVHEFITRHNDGFRSFVAGLDEVYFEKAKKYYEAPTVIDIASSSRGVFLVVREGMKYKVKLLRHNGEMVSLVSSRNLGEHVVIRAVYARRDGGRFAFFYTVAGSDEGYTRIVDTNSLEVIDEIKGSVWGIVWVHGEKYYYSRLYRRGKTPDGVEAPAERIILRDPGTGSEEVVFGYGYSTNYMMGIVEAWDPNRVFVLVEYGWQKSKIYGGLRSDPATWKLLFDGGEYRVFPLGYYGDHAYLIYYDRDGLGRVIRVKDGVYEEVIGEQGYPLRKGVLVGDKLYLEYLVDAASRLRVYSLDGVLLHEHVFGEPVSIRLLDYADSKVYLSVESFNKPSDIYVVEESSLKLVYSAPYRLDVVVKEEWCRSSDGTSVHMFVIHRKGVEPEKKAIVYGYGGFGIAITPFYLGPMLAFVEDGGVFVVANLRGGGEYGEKWHRMGMRENKQNVFEDYKAVLGHMKRKGFRTVGLGVSNGGLLVAATLTQSPRLFDVAVIGYPVIDMPRFHKLYIGKLWTTEYGDPDNPRDREYLLKYSPYHNVRRDEKYPPVLVYTGLHDDRVHHAHALKFVARLEEVGAPVYLRVELESGHMGASPETKLREYADILAFIHRVLSREA